jgi:hypothetical protein
MTGIVGVEGGAPQNNSQPSLEASYSLSGPVRQNNHNNTVCPPLPPPPLPHRPWLLGRCPVSVGGGGYNFYPDYHKIPPPYPALPCV